uniref:SFRICE_041114 n=1 Tax=Spodoptera frugiperda TaxID=7108 RepID=A0A2H1VTD1_SPOFR
MTLVQKKSWICQDCCCKIPKTGNLNTPIRTPINIETQLLHSPTEDNNVTFRKRKTNSSPASSFSQGLSFLGDTQYIENKDTPTSVNTEEELTLKNLNDIVTLSLRNNNKTIIAELQNTIQIEINKAIVKIREDIEGKLNTLSKEAEQQRDDIITINKKIEKLTIENDNLKREIKSLIATKVENSTHCYEDNRRKIVVYGFPEYYKESIYDEQYRLVDIFYNKLNVDLTEYLDETYRLGRNYNKNRPLVIEFTSKRITKYILENKHYLQGTRLFVSEYLDKNARSQRKEMHEEMLKARKNGLYAIIKNNQLIIEGKIIDIQKQQQNFHNNNNLTQKEQNQTEKCMEEVYRNSETLTHGTFRNSRPTI